MSTPADVCVHCGATVRTINYAMGPEVMHVDRHASFPTQHKGTAWRHCRMTVASLETVAPEPVTLTDGLLVTLNDALREEIAKVRLELGEWTARYESLRRAYDVAAEEWANDYADWTANNPGPSGRPTDPPLLDTYLARGGAR